MMKTGMTSTKLLLALLFVAIALPVFTIGGCLGAASLHKGLLQQYKEDYATWDWEKRYNMAIMLEITAGLADIEFSWLDLPVEKIEVNDAASGSTSATGSGCPDGR